MATFTPMQLGPEFVEALDGRTIYSDPDGQLLKVLPPKNNNGLNASIDLLRALYDYREEQTLLGSRNLSETSAFEVWYDKGELQFCYYTPSQKREMHYRQQIDGHFRGCQIESKMDLFPSISEGEYVAGAEVWLKNHYFEPIRDKTSEDWNDPYLLLFSELHTRDATRTVMQVLFQPAEPNWTRTPFENVDDYSAGMRNKRVDSRLLGLIKNQRDATPDEKEYADRITRQAGLPAFYVNIRYLTIAADPNDAIKHADNIAKRLELGYQTASGQTLNAEPITSSEGVAELIRKIAAREGTTMGRNRSLISDWKHAQFGDASKNMIMTLPEIAGLTHFPKKKDVDIPAIDWTEIPVEGTLPHNAQRFKRLSHSERHKQLKRWERQQAELLEELGLPEAANALKVGNPKDDAQDLRKRFEQGERPAPKDGEY